MLIFERTLLTIILSMIYEDSKKNIIEINYTIVSPNLYLICV